MPNPHGSVGTMLRASLVGCSSLLFTIGCASTPASPRAIPSKPTTDVVRAEFESLRTLLAADFNRLVSREREREQKAARQMALARPGVIIKKETLLSSLLMPVTHLGPEELEDTYGAPRDGGRRVHRGIDIFAPRGREVVAVTDGFVTSIAEQPKGGRCLWLETESGVSFYYAHLDRWASHLYEGVFVHAGELLGYVGNTGNAKTTPPHLHFVVVSEDEALNPYPILRTATRSRPRPMVASGAVGGSQ